MHSTEAYSATRAIKSFVLCPIPTAIFLCPACCFKWHAFHRRKASGVLGSPIGLITGRRASPTRRSFTPQITQGLSGFQHTYKRENGRLHLYGETCHHFALFSYLHPDNKVKPESVTSIEFNAIDLIMKISVEPVFLVLFYNHSLVI